MEHEAIVRVESYHKKIEDRSDSFVVLGYTYRPLYPVALKAEYQWHSYREEKMLMVVSLSAEKFVLITKRRDQKYLSQKETLFG